MRKVLLKCLMLFVPMLCMSLATLADGVIKGKIIDAKTNEALIGATATIDGTSIGAAADIDGNFVIKTKKDGKMVILFRYVGYEELKKEIDLKDKELDMGTIKLTPVTVGLDEVKVTASIVTKDRETPVAISNITPLMIEEKLGSQEFPEIMKSTPSIYATKQGGGYGDSRINMRGFDSNNIGILINGIPINDMENGRVYWSNWASLSDVTQFIQVQRGLGASKLAVNSVGGTMNMITKSTDAIRGGGLYYGIGNDGYSKAAVNVSTGLMENGWAVSLAGSRTASTHGYVDATNYEAWAYFVNVSKRINDNHRLSFTAFGAPQWHNQRGQMHTIQEYRDNQNGTRWNSSYGILNGEIFNGPYAYNEYHKPQMSLNHYWTINERSSLSTVVYLSFSNGGGRRSYGVNKNWLQYNYTDGKPYEETKLTPDGLLDYDAVMRENQASTTGSLLVLANTINSHDWYGALSTYTNQITDNIKLTGGLDVRYYKGYHFIKITDLMGGAYYNNKSDLLAYQDPNVALKKGDKIAFDNTGEVLWAGIFAQGEYVKDNFSGFLSFSLTDEAYRRIDNGAYKKGDPMRKTNWQNFLPWSLKAGANYKFGAYHNVYLNGGYFKRAPYFNVVFKNNTNVITPNVKYETVYTIEGGYGFEMPTLTAKINYYYTRWNDRGLTKSVGNGNVANIRGLNACHQGVEFEAEYKPVYNFNLTGMFSWGNWILTDNPTMVVLDASNEVVSENEKLYVKDVHVGNSAQMTAALGASYEPFTRFKIGADMNFFGKNYSDYTIENRVAAREEGIDSWRMPNYVTVDANLRYGLDYKGVRFTLYTNINNVFNAKYIADAKDGAYHNAASSLVYYGFGRTWTLGLRLNF